LNLLSRSSSGHHPVNADWKRFTPIKPVNHNHFNEMVIASNVDIMIKDPAVARMMFSTVMSFSLVKIALLDCIII